jgi:FemAB-related protein (PEP-CTERM system-associated)
MFIREYTCQDKNGWDEYVLNHSSALPYHFIAWKEAVEAAYNFKSHYLMATLDHKANSPILGVLPIIHHHLPYRRGEFVSLPYCDAAGPIADSIEIEGALIKAALSKSETLGLKKLSLRSIAPIATVDTHMPPNKDKVRMILKLPGSSEILWDSFKAKLRSQIKKPMKDGLTAHLCGQEAIYDFYPLFAENMRDLGSPVHSLKWMKSVLKSYHNRAHLVIIKMPDGKVAAGGIILCHPNQVSVPWASSLRYYNYCSPNMLLYWALLKFSCDMGYPLFDFGRSTPGEGTYRFKKQWGAHPASLFWFDSDTSDKQDQIIRKFKPRQVAESIIKKMPVPLMNLVGPAIRKYVNL